MQLVSLIITVYNGEKYLDACLNSVINQTYSNLEIIIIDDGSNDRSMEILDKYMKIDSRIVVIHQENMGCSYARNRGLLQARGEYVGIIDQDDVIHQNYVAYLMHLIEVTHASVATTHKVKEFAGSLEKMQDISKLDDYEVWSGIKAAQAMLLHNLQVGPWNKLIKKSLLERNAILFQEQFYCGEGLAFSVEAFQASQQVVVGKEIIYFYRIDNAGSGTSSFSEKKLRSALCATDYIWEKLNNKSRRAKRIIRFEKWRTTVSWFVVLSLSKGKNQNLNIYKELKRNSRKNSLNTLFLSVGFKQKILACVFFISPLLGGYLLGRWQNRKTDGKFRR